MTTVLAIDTSPSTNSVSRSLVEQFITKLTAANPGTQIIHRDVGLTPPEHLDDALIDALRRQPETLDARQQAARDASDAMVEELKAADVVVIGAPFHNFSISGAFRTWIDHIARPGVTFGYKPDVGPVGLIDDKPVYVISARGGKYGSGDVNDPHPADFQTPYVRHVLKFMGISDVRIIAANGMDMGDEHRAQGLAEAGAKIDAAVAEIATAQAA